MKLFEGNSMERYLGKKEYKPFFKYLEKNGYTPNKKATKDEFSKLIELSPKPLPKAYLDFMRYAGNGYRLWKGSVYTINKIPELREAAEYLLYIENQVPYKLSEDSFVFWMHQGYMFYFFNLNEGDDPPVYYYNECKHQDDFIKCYDSFTDFIMDPFITGKPNPL